MGVVERPEVLLEVAVGEEDAHPGAVVELGVGPAPRVQHRPAHPGHEQHRLARPLLLRRAAVPASPRATPAASAEAEVAAEHAEPHPCEGAEHGGGAAGLALAVRRPWGATGGVY